MFHPRVIALGLVAVTQVLPALAAGADPVPPSAGTVIQNLPQLPAPRAPRAPELRVMRPLIAAGAQDSTPIPVTALTLVGNKFLTSAELVVSSEFKPGLLNLDQLRALAARMVDAYHQRGYFLAQVLVPAQDIAVEGGAVTLQVFEGGFGALTLRNQSRLHEGVVRGLLGAQNAPGQPIVAAPLERALLLMADVPGVAMQSTLTPGSSVGTSDLLIDVADTRRYSGSVDADNEGNPYTGRVRVGATLNVNNPLGLGDVLSARVFGATNGLLQYGHVAYQLTAGQAQVGLGYTHMTYWLGGIYTSLSATGYGDIGSVFASYPLLRSHSANLSAGLNFDAKYFSDSQRSAGTNSAKGAQVLSASLSGDAQDGWVEGAVSSFALTAMAGQLDLRGADAQAADFSTARTNGSYAKLVYSGSRLQRVTADKSVFVSLNGQFASKNLDVSEKMQLGGANAVRAYPEGEGYGDQGVVLKVEARWDLPRWQLASVALSTQPQLFAFVDSGRVTLNKDNATPLPNERSLSGAGLGLNLISGRDQDVLVRLVWSHKLGSAPATSSPDAASRVWLQLVKSL